MLNFNEIKKMIEGLDKGWRVKSESILFMDFNGDGEAEIAAGCAADGGDCLVLLKNNGDTWSIADQMSRKGSEIRFIQPFQIGVSTIAVGWDDRTHGPKLGIYSFGHGKISPVLREEAAFDKIEIEDMPGRKGMDGIDEIAIWRHESGEAYRIGVYRLSKGRLIAAYDLYPYYFRKAEEYFSSKSHSDVESSFYRYYLAEVQWNAGDVLKSFSTLQTAIMLENPYPSEKELKVIRDQIEAVIDQKSVQLFPAPVKTVYGDKWGYINKRGIFSLKPIYDSASNFQESNTAIISKSNLYGIIDPLGNELVPPVYSIINALASDRWGAGSSKGFSVIDQNGKVLTTDYFDYIGTFHEGRALCGKQKQGQYVYGYLDHSGQLAIPLQYMEAGDFSHDGAVVKEGENRYSLIDNSGTSLMQYHHYFVGECRDGMLAFREEMESKLGYIHKNGEIAITPRFTSAQPFQGGKAVVGENGKYGLIDHSGNFIIKPIYDDVQMLGEGRAAVGKAVDKTIPFMGFPSALFDLKGKQLTDFKFDGMLPFEYGLSSVFDDKRTYFINMNGEMATSLPVLEGQGILTVDKTLIKAEIDRRTAYYDFHGAIVWKQPSDIHLNSQWRLMEQKAKPNKNYLVYYPEVQGMNSFEQQKALNAEYKKAANIKSIPIAEKLDYRYEGDFSVAFFKKDLLSVEFDGYQYYFGAAHGMPSKVFVHANLKNGKVFSLADLFKGKSNYVKHLNEIISEKIKNDPQYEYVFPDSFQGIKSDQSFYLNDDSLIIYFTPYEIAPFAAGFPEFKIPYKDLEPLINKQGELWLAFH
ncbi:WG repeat-containing protein [Falsibacillus pallidus]|uniref:WG repeat protein n=1 Tax=Falsibacillus pallidus TaxID=493781 RepID=A0A370GET4_9BACI|nr:WG repeat-containing protein [Falsibacillus pallidus]RDI42318.1 WG repeat protein [Falsibacillus pallidus]